MIIFKFVFIYETKRIILLIATKLQCLYFDNKNLIKTKLSIFLVKDSFFF